MSLEMLYLGLVEYHWVRDEKDGMWTVTDVDGNERIINGGAYHVTPDLELGADLRRRPVHRLMRDGKPAQYFRFERKAVS
jgi:hypothetical protein